MYCFTSAYVYLNGWNLKYTLLGWKQCIVVIYDSAERVPLWLSANQRAKAQFESGSYVTSLNILNPISGTVGLLSGAQKYKSHIWDQTGYRSKG